jgi:prepilin-type processing-associated H-X9-DG protein
MRLIIPVLLGLTISIPARAEVPPELAYVPPDAALVVHARVADLWKSDGLKDIRRIVLKAGPEALATLDKRFTPPPSTAERVTAYVLAPTGDAPLMAVVFLTFNKPFDKDAVVKNSLPKAKAVKAKQTEWYGDEDADYGVLFFGDRRLAFGNYAAIAKLADASPARESVAVAFPELADPAKLVAVAGNLSALPPRALNDLADELPPALRPLLKAKNVVVSLDSAGGGTLHARVTYPDKAAADAAEKAIQDGVVMAKEFIGQARVELKKLLEGDGKPGTVDELPYAVLGLVGLGALQEAEDLLNDLPLKRTGESFALTVAIPAELRPLVLGSGMAAGILVPAVQKIRQSADRMKDSNNLKQFGLAIHNYHDTFGFMPAAICDKDGKPLLSWRVAILPFIEHENLYKQFKLDEPWDSEHNKKLIEKMPKIFEIPGSRVKAGHTHYRTFVGEGAPWKNYSARAMIPATFLDGTSNTWMIVEAEEAVTWTKPEELPYDGKTEPKLGKFFSGGFNVAFWDGSVRFFPKVPKGVHKYINPADGQVIDPDDDK